MASDEKAEIWKLACREGIDINQARQIYEAQKAEREKQKELERERKIKQEVKKELQEKEAEKKQSDPSVEKLIRNIEGKLDEADVLVADLEKMQEGYKTELEETSSELATEVATDVKKRYEKMYAEAVEAVKKQANDEIERNIEAFLAVIEKSEPLIFLVSRIVAFMEHEPKENVHWRIDLFNTKNGIQPVMENLTKEGS
jgi:uncharacterized glyoxalase superfamily protein PhnB